MLRVAFTRVNMRISDGRERKLTYILMNGKVYYLSKVNIVSVVKCMLIEEMNVCARMRGNLHFFALHQRY